MISLATEAVKYNNISDIKELMKRHVDGSNIKIHLLNFFFLFLISFHGQADETLIAPEGFKIDVFASEIQNPRQIAQGDDGYFFVGSKAGMVYALKDFDNNGVIDFKTIIADDMSDASGVAFKMVLYT